MTKLFDTYRLSAAPTNNDEVNMDVQRGYCVKDTTGPVSSANPPISVVAPKPLSSNMEPRSVLPTKITSFALKFYDITRY